MSVGLAENKWAMQAEAENMTATSSTHKYGHRFLQVDSFTTSL